MATHRYGLLLGLALVLSNNSAFAKEKPKTPAHPRPLQEIKKTLETILSGADKNDENAQALQRLKAYRYLAEAPYADLTLDENYNKMCLAGAKLCERIGKMDHHPKNPGLPEEEYKLAYNGTSQSNLAQGYRSLVDAVDTWMADSDNFNIGQLGHRRWCINPTMAKTGFGRSGIFCAMFSFDRNRKNVPDFDYVCFPARGYMPIEFFGEKLPWNVSLNPKKYKTPDKQFSPKIYLADAAGMKKGDPLPLNFKKVDAVPFGIPSCIIFRPEKLTLTPGDRYVVELEGIQPQGPGAPVTLRYLVEFVTMK
jgi:hypothetical protein